MIIRQGYVAIALNLKNVTSSSTVTFATYNKLKSEEERLDLCQEINCPMVLDLHHHKCKNDGENIADLLEDIFNTWNNESLPPKVHFSSPRESEFDRKHADFIDVNDFANFLNIAKETTNKDFDVMIEAKKKDQALLKLVKDLKKINYPCEFLDSSTIKI